MRESEDAVREHAGSGDEIPRRVCSQLLANRPRYSEWHALHEGRMRNVAEAHRRDPQILKLRALAIQQVHSTALVNYLRIGRITGPQRDRALGLFHGVIDSRDATLAAHRNYLLAASTQVCTYDLLDLVGDTEGVELVRRYELAYSQYFALFCERALATQSGRNYLLGPLLPEVKDVADRLRLRILSSDVRATSLRRPAAAVAQQGSPARTLSPGIERRNRVPAAPRAATPPAVPGARSRTAR
jgi:hypothetical protein